MSMPLLSCALLTPPGRGAIAVIAVFGESAAEVVEPWFRSASDRRISDATRQSILYGHWQSSGEDVVLIRLADRVEIHCHGGSAAAAAIMRSLESSGISRLSQLETAAMLFGKGWQAELAVALTKAPTERTAEILLSQFNQATELLSQLQLWFGSENPASHQQALATLKQSLAFADFGLHLTRPWSVVLCGRPNVGKSSLINALVGFERAIVHHEAGTTRDVVTQLSAVEGWPIELKDTAGLRETENRIERQGVEFSQTEIQEADLVIAVFDVTEFETQCFEWELVADINAKIIVLNKLDLVSPSAAIKLKSPDGPEQSQLTIIETSTIRQIGIQNLISAIAKHLVPTLPPVGLLIPVTQQQVDGLERIVALKDEVNLAFAKTLFETLLP